MSKTGWCRCFKDNFDLSPRLDLSRICFNSELITEKNGRLLLVNPSPVLHQPYKMVVKIILIQVLRDHQALSNMLGFKARPSRFLDEFIPSMRIIVVIHDVANGIFRRFGRHIYSHIFVTINHPILSNVFLESLDHRCKLALVIRRKSIKYYTNFCPSRCVSFF